MNGYEYGLYFRFAGVNSNTEWDKYKTMYNTQSGIGIRQRAPSLFRVQCKWGLFNSIYTIIYDVITLIYSSYR